MTRQNLLSLQPSRLAHLVQGSGRARRIWRLLSRGQDPLTHGTLGRQALRLLQQHTMLGRPEIAEQRISDDGSHKLAIQLEHGHQVEIVLIPGRARSTLCVSTQVGCAHRCAFCRTGSMGLCRQLSSDEILQQVWLALRLSAEAHMPPLRNVVFMGMGEPLDNLDAVATACGQLVDPLAFAFGPRHLTLSTVAPSAERVVRAAILPVNLAWSLHAADARLRKELVPSARYAPEILRDAFVEALAGCGRDLFVEIVLLDGVNDGAAHAQALIRLLEPLRRRCRVNVLPVNAETNERFRPSPDAAVALFCRRLRDAGFFCMQRRARAQDIDGACGRLLTKAPPAITTRSAR